MLMQQELVLTEMQELRRANKLECWQCNKDFACLVLEMQYKGQAPHPIAFGGGSSKLAVETLEPHCLPMGDLSFIWSIAPFFSVSKLSILFKHRASQHMPLATHACEVQHLWWLWLFCACDSWLLVVDFVFACFCYLFAFFGIPS